MTEATKSFIIKITFFIMPISLMANIGMIYQMNVLPSQIQEVILSSQKKDTVVVTKKITATLNHFSDLVNFKGVIIGESFKISETYDIVPMKLPKEITDGWLTPISHDNDGHYLLWSKDKIITTDSEYAIKGGTTNTYIDGYFHVESRYLQYGEEFLQTLMPVMITKNY